MLPLSWIALGFAALPHQPAQQPAPEPATAALVALVDAPTAEARARTARELAARTDVTLAQWLAAARALPLRRTEPAVVDGRNRLYRVALPILGAERAAEIHVRVPADAERRTGPLPLLFVWHAARGDGAQALAQWAPLADRGGFLLAGPTETYERAPLVRAEGAFRAAMRPRWSWFVRTADESQDDWKHW